MTVIVITLFKPSDAYKADPNLGNSGLKVISDLEGILGNYHGIQTENSDVAYHITVAEKVENFTVVRDNKELFESIVNGLAPTRIGGIEQYHLVAISDPFKALSKPVTEIAMFSVKEPIEANKKTVEEIINGWSKVTEGTITFGWALEDTSKGFVIAAWDTIEQHLERRKQPDIAGALQTFMEITEISGSDAVHVTLTKFQ